MDQEFESFQDLGEMRQRIRSQDGIGSTGVEVLPPDDDGNHGEALAEIREVVDEHYGDHISELEGDDEILVIEKISFRSDGLPYILYQRIDDWEDDNE